MKILSLNLKENVVQLLMENQEDFYTFYRFLRPDDKLGSKTTRRIKDDEMGGSKGGRESVFIEILVEKIHFYGFGEDLRVSGPITSASDPAISLNSYHSHTISLFQEIRVQSNNRSEEDYLQLQEQVVGESLGTVILVMDDGLAQFYLLGSYGAKLLSEIVPTIPRKSSSPAQHQESTELYFGELTAYFNELAQNQNIHSRFVIGPGFTRENFMDYLKEHAGDLVANTISKPVKSTGKSGLLEFLDTGLPEQLAKELHVVQQTRLLNQAMEALHTGENSITYGLAHVQKAAELGAIEDLLVLDDKLHESLETRDILDGLMTSIRQYGGNVHYISNSNPSYEVIEGLGGMIALLRFAVD